jgi:DNA-binding transcriptional MerR regulator
MAKAGQAYTIKALSHDSGVSYQTLYHWVKIERSIPAPDTMCGLRQFYSAEGYQRALRAAKRLKAQIIRVKQLKAGPILRP